VRRPLEILISGAGIAGPTLAYWLVRRGHRPVLVERTPELCVGGHAVDIRGTALEVMERMRLETAVRDARTQILTLSAVRPDGRRTYDVALRQMHEARGDREIEIMRDDLVRILFGAVRDDVEVVFGDSVRAREAPSDLRRLRRCPGPGQTSRAAAGRRRTSPRADHVPAPGLSRCSCRC
jgi:2-polyprenyl-6-methoxyphenol hydroxylase-like FAD-dependent oxidoreductase